MIWKLILVLWLAPAAFFLAALSVCLVLERRRLTEAAGGTAKVDEAVGTAKQ